MLKPASNKRQTICLLLALTIPLSALAEEKSAEQLSMDKLIQAREGLKTRVLEQCGLTAGTTEYPTTFSILDENFRDTGFHPTERMLLEVKTWTGGCLDGKRDGQGVIVTREKTEIDGRQSTHVTLIKAEGRFVQGRKQGLWCTLQYEGSTNGDPPTSLALRGCSIDAGGDGTALYRKLPDGRWEETDGGGQPTTPSVVLAAGTLEAESERIIAEAIAGKSDLALRPFTLESNALQGLIAGAKITESESREPVSIKGKRIALILSSRSIAELEGFVAQRQAFIDASANIGEVSMDRAKFIDASRPELLMQAIATSLRRVAAKVVPMDDLTGLSEGEFDYAIVVDWRSVTRFDLLGKFNSAPVIKDYLDPRSAIAGQSLSGFLIAPDLKLMSTRYWGDGYGHKMSECVQSRRERTCDSDYLKLLAYFYESRWMSPEPAKAPFAYQLK